MTYAIKNAKGALTGAMYKNSLRDSREVWLNGERVDVTSHPVFSGMLNELSHLFDRQHAPENRDKMTFVSPLTGNRVSYSYLLPYSATDLAAKRCNTNLWMEASWGLLARVPDFMSNVVVGLYDFRNVLQSADKRFAENVVQYHSYCQENDIVLTHAIGDPQIDRSISPLDDPDIALRVIKETSEGVIVRGAKQLATLAPFSNEILVYLSPSFAARNSKEFVIWFALPIATPGLKLLCREPYITNTDLKKHPFSSLYDEQDAMVFFDDVLVPWERIFLLYDSKLAFWGFQRINAWALYCNAIRFHQRLRTFIGIASLLADAIGVKEFRNIQERLGELVSYAEIARLVIQGMEAEASVTDGGLLAPGSVESPGILAAQIASRIVEIIREIGASGLIMHPSEADLTQPQLRSFLDKYMRGRDVNAVEKSRLFRLAWDLVGNGYGIRQDLYERWNRGDLARNRINLFLNYDCNAVINRIQDLIREPVS